MSVKRPDAPAADPPRLDPDQLFGNLEAARGLVLAVSGGPDSIALMVLMAGWASRPPCLVVTVDHGLRSQSADEAQVVAANAARVGLPARITRAPNRSGAGNLQDWARRARYACLAQAAREAGSDAIVTAHHLDDQAETFLMRLARGSGVYGLAAMAAEGRAEGIRLHRPLLRVPRTVLARIAEDSGLPLAADPSNADPVFDRVRLRALMPQLAPHGLSPERLAGTAGRMRRAAAALDHYAAALLSENFQADRFGVVTGAADALRQAPEEVALRALVLMINAAGGADYPPPLERSEALLSAILAPPERGRIRRTLQGVVITRDAGTLRAYREWGREGLASVPASSGSPLIWDRRFRVEVPPCADFAVGGLGGSRRRLRSNHAEHDAVRALPGLFRGGSLLAVPDGVWAADGGDNLERLVTECLVGTRLGLPAAPLITI